MEAFSYVPIFCLPRSYLTCSYFDSLVYTALAKYNWGINANFHLPTYWEAVVLASKRCKDINGFNTRVDLFEQKFSMEQIISFQRLWFLYMPSFY
ncbi:conserved hypothetical protein [Ricinus communis]|uniref:Uncharacterized protein n=1 Tax=Ricinus communis TaxID=3988 RepID=B9RAT9_RICCO|nr:conserved hypothetical protein [Ricinus communis]